MSKTKVVGDIRFLLIAYVNSATDLAESLQRDIIKGREYSSATVLKLSKFVAAAERFRHVEELLSELQAANIKNMN